MAIADAVNAAVQTAQTATPAPAPATGTPAPAAAPSPAQTKTEPEPAPTLFFHRKEKPEAVDLATLDPTKLPPEAQPFYKSMQADYTRKTQAVADERRQIEAQKAALAEQRKVLEDFLSKVAQGKTEASAPTAIDPMEEVRLLRENGDHDAADRKLMEYITAQQEAALAPQRQEIALEKAKATFRETLAKTVQTDPLVQQNQEYVTTNFDRVDDPRWNQIRGMALSSPEAMEVGVPFLMHYFAIENAFNNLKTLTTERFNAAVQEQVKAERAKAAGLPAKLVSSGATSQAGERQKMSLEESVRAAMESLTSG